MSYFGWSKEWFDEWGDPKVGETLIKFFVNRYFAFPEDWDQDDKPLVMVFVKCRICGNIQEHYTTETEEDAENFIYNWHDQTYVSLSNIACKNCGLVWNARLEQFWEDYAVNAEEKYEYLTPEFDSPVEEMFWKTWREVLPQFALIPQYLIGRYRVDFAHVPTRVAIEIDGDQYHSAPAQVIRDQRRQMEIERLGWCFLRFKAADILKNAVGSVLITLSFLVDKAYKSA